MKRIALDLLARVVHGLDRAPRGVPTLEEAFAEYLSANPDRKSRTEEQYRSQMRYCLGDWFGRPLDTITRREVEERFHRVSRRHGWSIGNHAISLLRAVYRRPCVDFPWLRNPVDLWLTAGGRFHRPVRRLIPAPAEVLPLWRGAIEAVVPAGGTRDAFWFGFYTGMRRGEIIALSWDRIDLPARSLMVKATKTGTTIELPITRQLNEILKRRSGHPRWVFPSGTSASGHIEELQHLYTPISSMAGTKFWFHGLRNAFITVAVRDLMLPMSLAKRLVNHTRPSDVTENYAADWTVDQLREPAQQIADRLDELASGPAEVPARRGGRSAPRSRSGDRGPEPVSPLPPPPLR